MGVYQVLEVQRGEVDGPTYELVPSAEDSMPEDFEAQGRRPAYFGSADIVELALSLEGNNYIPTDVAIADASFERIRPEEIAAESEALLAALRSGDKRASMTVLAERLPGMIIEALTLRGRRDHRGSTLRVLQDGVIQVISAAVGARPDDDVRRALT